MERSHGLASFLNAAREVGLALPHPSWSKECATGWPLRTSSAHPGEDLAVRVRLASFNYLPEPFDGSRDDDNSCEGLYAVNTACPNAT